MRYVFILKDDRALVFDEKGASEWLREVFPTNWPVTVLREDGPEWYRVVPELVWDTENKKHAIVWRFI